MSSSEIAIGIITALPVESAAMQIILDSPTDGAAEDDTNPYVMGSVPSRIPEIPHRVVLATQALDGTRSAASICTDLVRSFPSLRHVVMCGIAGGVPAVPDPAGLTLGDIVSASEGVVDYDHVRAINGQNRLRRPVEGLSMTLLAAERQLQAKERLGTSPWVAKLEQTIAARPRFGRPPASSDPRFAPRQTHPGRTADLPYVHRGRIGSADRLVQDPVFRDRLADEHGVLAVEMEGSGIAIAADLHATQWYVVRGVADYCDKQKNDAWHAYAALVAAAYTWALLGEVPPLAPSDGGRRRSEGDAQVPALNALDSITGALLSLEVADAEQSRRTLLRLLPRYIREQVPSHPEARLHVLEIVRTCERYPKGRDALLQALATLLGDYSPDYLRVEAVLARHWPG